MSFEALLVYPLQVARRTVTGEGDYGEDEVDFVAGATIQGWAEARASSEELEDRDTAVGDWLVLLPIGTTVEAYDRIIYAGQTLEVIGPPREAPSLEGPHHLELDARWIEG